MTKQRRRSSSGYSAGRPSFLSARSVVAVPETLSSAREVRRTLLKQQPGGVLVKNSGLVVQGEAQQRG